MDLPIRKIVTSMEEIRIEGGRRADRPVTSIVVAAVLANPWAGRGPVEDLAPEIRRIAPPLAEEMSAILLARMPATEVEAFGKSGIAGTAGEVEHGAAIIHTLRFGNVVRDRLAGTTYLSFTNIRTGPGALISIPMIHKSTTGQRSHFLTATVQIPDAPAPDELLIAIAACNGGRPHPRIGDRFRDMVEMEAEAAAAAQARD